jgi:hypothetical protein
MSWELLAVVGGVAVVLGIAKHFGLLGMGGS